MKVAWLILVSVLIAGCGSGAQPSGTAPRAAPTTAGKTAAAGTQSTGGGSLLDKAKALEHMCALLPTDLVATVVPSPGPPQEERYPLRCSVYSDTVAIGASIDPYNTISDMPADGKAVSGVGTSAYVQTLAKGNFTLYVGLTPEGGILMVEVNNQDGKDHTDEAVSLANAIIQKLSG